MRSKGMSLTLLLVIIVIIGLVAAVAVPRFMGSHEGSQERQRKLEDAERFLLDSTAATVDLGVQLYSQLAEYNELLLFDEWVALRDPNHSYNLAMRGDVARYQQALLYALVWKYSESSYLAGYANLRTLSSDIPTDIMRGMVPYVSEPGLAEIAAPLREKLEQSRARWREMKERWDSAYDLCESHRRMPDIPRYEHAHLETGKIVDLWPGRRYPWRPGLAEQNGAIAEWLGERNLPVPQQFR